jgi:hypothetical protein
MALQAITSCPNCGGSMIGDGFTFVSHCEHAHDDDYWYEAPDAGPIYCRPDLLLVGQADKVDMVAFFTALKNNA